MARASSANDAMVHTVLTTWCAARAMTPACVAIATVARSASLSEIVRTSSGRPATNAPPRPVSEGLKETPSGRAFLTTTDTNATHISVWVTERPMPAPSIPMLRPKIRSRFSPTLTIEPPARTYRGVFMSRTPRRVPVAARITSMGSMPKDAPLR